MKKKLLQLAVALESATKAFKAEKDATKKKALEAAKKKALAEYNLVLDSVVESERKKESGEDESKEDEDEGEDGEEDPTDHMAALQQHVPQADGENDQQYQDRLAAIKTHATKAGAAPAGGSEDESEEEEDESEAFAGTPPKPGAVPGGAPQQQARHKETAAVRKFRKENPVLYGEIMTKARETVGAERSDFKTLKQRLDILESENRALRLDKTIAACDAMLKEAGIPADIMTAADLVKLDSGARKREVARLKLSMGRGQESESRYFGLPKATGSGTANFLENIDLG